MAAHLGSFGELTNTIKDVAVAGGTLVLAGTLPFSDEHVNLLNKRESEQPSMHTRKLLNSVGEGV